MEVKITDNSQLFINAKNDAVARALEAIGLTAERHAKERCPVDTGRLRNSITHATKHYNGQGVYSDNQGRGFADATAKQTVTEPDAVYIGTNVEYAQKQETGNYKHTTGASHFLRDAAATHGDEYKKIAETQLRKA